MPSNQLPRQSKKKEDNKLNLVLDLDNTIISSLSFKELDKKIKNRKLSFDDMEDYYRVFHRPYLQEFLDYAFNNFHVSVWTAASRDYASFIIDNIILQNSGRFPNIRKTNRKLRMYLWDDNCAESQKIYNSKSPKDLTYLYNFEGFYPCNTMIMDDLVDVHEANEGRVIKAKYFDSKKEESERDTFLKDIIPKLEEVNKKYRNKRTCTLHDH